MQMDDRLVRMPALGETTPEGTVARWRRAPGDRVSAGEAIAEIVTDKVSEELLSPVDGILGTHLVAAGQAASVGAPLVSVLPDAGSGTPMPLMTSPPQTANPVPNGSKFSSPNTRGATGGPHLGVPGFEQATASVSDLTLPAAGAASESAARSSPLVRRLADEHGIDLATVVGTGPGGRITKDDIVGAVAAKARSGSTSPEDPAPDTELHAPSPLRQVIASNLVRAVQGVPQAWTLVEVDATGLLSFRDANRSAVASRTGLKLSVFATFVHVVAQTISAHPLINGSWREGSGGVGAVGEAGGRVVTYRSVNAGIAVARPGGGLLVPVIRNAAKLPLDRLVSELDSAVSGARAGTLGADAYSGATVTLNNTGALGSVISQPILPSGTSAIIAFEAIVKRPVVVAGDAIAIRPMVNVCLTFDHRVLDGLEACSFLQRLKQSLEGLSGHS
jgi:2-oxoisovalerate dehydrogenase E2 component (dihydrolipoyl transacylase)